jgi:RES domain-containing protein
VPDCLPPSQPAPHDGRYHLAGDPWPLYGALDRATVWAEWARATDGGVRPEDDRRNLCVFEADLLVLDLRDAAVRAALSVTLEQLVAAWSTEAPNEACIRAARQAVAFGADGLIVPSAARSEGWTVVVLPAAFGKLHRRSRRTTTPAPPSQG